MHQKAIEISVSQLANAESHEVPTTLNANSSWLSWLPVFVAQPRLLGCHSPVFGLAIGLEIASNTQIRDSHAVRNMATPFHLCSKALHTHWGEKYPLFFYLLWTAIHCNDQNCDHHHKNHIESQSQSQQPLHLKHWVVDASARELIVYPLNHCYLPSTGLHIEGPSLQRLFSDLQNNIRAARSLIFGVSGIIALGLRYQLRKKVPSQKQGHVATCTILWSQAIVCYVQSLAPRHG